MVTERNITNSFRLVKNDIMRIQDELVEMSQRQSEILKQLDKIGLKEFRLEKKVEESAKRKPRTKTKIITKTVTKRAKSQYVASKTGKNFHIVQCPFAQNIKPRGKVVFKSKVTALNKGYKPCNCVK